MARKIRREISINGVTRWISADTEQEFADKVIAASGSSGCSVTPNAEKHDFCTYATQWFEVFSRPNIAQATAATYNHVLNKHLFTAFAGKYVEDLTLSDIQQMFNSMDCTKATKQKVKTVLNMILNLALDEGLIQRSPLESQNVRVKGRASKSTEPYSIAQMQYLVQNIHRVRKPLDREFLALQALHPLRLSETLGLQWQDIDLDLLQIHVRKSVTHPQRNQPVIKDTKTAESVRTLALVPQIIQYLIPGAPEDFVIGGNEPISYTKLNRMYERIRKDLAFEEPIRARRFRTTVLTDLYDTTKDIKQTQQAAGHTTPNMTLKHYVKGRSSNTSTAAAIASAYGLS